MLPRQRGRIVRWDLITRRAGIAPEAGTQWYAFDLQEIKAGDRSRLALGARVEFSESSTDTERRAVDISILDPHEAESIRAGVRSGAARVKWFSDEKGFGFLVPEDGGEEIFVHQTVIASNGRRTLVESESVELDAWRSERGWLATAVRRFDPGLQARHRTTARRTST